MEKMGFQLPADVLEVYKIQVIDKLKEGFDYAEVPCELLVALIERAQAWMRLEADEKKFQEEKASHGTSDVG